MARRTQESLTCAEEHRKAGRLDEALATYDALIEEVPDHAEAHSGRGATLAMKGQLEEAVLSFEMAVELDPKLTKGWYNLGLAFHKSGVGDRAASCFECALDLDPKHDKALTQLGLLCSRRGDVQQGIGLGMRAAALQPNHPGIHHNLGMMLAQSGQHERAINHFDTALILAPHQNDSWRSRAASKEAIGDVDGAMADYRGTLERQSFDVEALNNLGCLLQREGRLSDAATMFEAAVVVRPEVVETLTNLGTVLRDIGHIDRAIEVMGESVRADPTSMAARRNLLLSLHYGDAATPHHIFEQHRELGKISARQIEPLPSPDPDREPNRALRIGYLTADGRKRSVACFLESILSAHERAHYEIHAYIDIGMSDETTHRLLDHCDHHRNIAGESDEDVARTIVADDIDILVDLDGHSHHSRAMVTAYRPAPLQLSYLGYPDTTGLPEVDYRITDAIADPPGAEARYTERLLRLDVGAWCFSPEKVTPPVTPAPSATGRGFTFGSFNVAAKLSARALETWGGILREAPDARLMVHSLGAEDRAVRERILGALVEAGIDQSRVELHPFESKADRRLVCYEEIDIALDSFPYNGTVTTCEALWMGVPVVTLVGATHAARAGASLLHRVALDDLVADTTVEYMDIALRLAKDPERLAALRSTLRDRMVNSPLVDAERFVSSLERSYRAIWRTFCAS